MKQAEAIIAKKISSAFEGVRPIKEKYEFESWQEIPDAWIAKNEDLFSFNSHPEEHFLLPAFMCYLLRTYTDNPQSVVYLNIAGTLTQYSKEKSTTCFKNTITVQQFQAIEAFIKHFTYNQKTNIDREQWEKTLGNWVRNEE